MKKILLTLILATTIFANPLIGTKAKPFFLRNKNSTQKEFIKLNQELKDGNIVVLAFFASWCQPCKAELPYLEQLSKSKENLSIIAVSVDKVWDTKSRKFVEDLNLSIPVIHDKYRLLSKNYEYTGQLPYTIYIKSDGTISDITNEFSENEKSKINKIVDKLAE